MQRSGKLRYNLACVIIVNNEAKLYFDDFSSLQVFHVPMSKAPKRYSVTVPKNGNMVDLCKGLEPMCGIAQNKMIVTNVISHRFHKIYKRDEKLTNIADIHDSNKYRIFM